MGMAATETHIGISVVSTINGQLVITKIREDAENWIVIKSLDAHALPVAFGDDWKTSIH